VLVVQEVVQHQTIKVVVEVVAVDTVKQHKAHLPLL
jgi:hypothetical protein